MTASRGYGSVGAARKRVHDVPGLVSRVRQLEEDLAASEAEREDLDTGAGTLLGENVELGQQLKEVSAELTAVLREVRSAAVYMIDRRTHWATRSDDLSAIPRAVAYQHIAGHLIRILEAHPRGYPPAPDPEPALVATTVSCPDCAVDAAAAVPDEDWAPVQVQLEALRHCQTDKGRRAIAARIRRIVGGMVRRG
ncbi:hypothetical protein KVF89_22525 [Nocardioides carbamazepini]|uniref:hypothetical protein n=1 Tax=Nocardioides carbamazepini TaxID=2854259 RepID=UPI002149AACA|nr:hypothetical protein [Nocardioides carbamazepini]MCR1785333.1 hypothetical protein [Nocardioides carbamazepini]